MLTVGQGLYNLTERDQATLYVDSFFRNSTVTIAAASANGTTDFRIPSDRCLYLHQINIKGDASALSTWSEFSVNAVSNDGFTVYRIFGALNDSGLSSDNGTSAAGSTCTLYRRLDIMLPPGIAIIRLVAARLVTTNAATATMFINGYLIPPGQFGRIS